MELAYVRMVLDSCFYERIMNMKKLLATGLIASVAMSSAESSASCGNGGFYVGANMGVAFTKAKATFEAKTDYKDNNPYGAEASGWKIGAMNANNKNITAVAANKRSALAVEALKNSKSKKKTNALAELVLGYDFRLSDVMIGVELNAGGIFGTSRLNRTGFTIKAADGTTANSGAAVMHDTAAVDTSIAGEEYAKVREQWHIALMPRVGYLFTPQFEGYVTFGVKLAKFTTVVNDLPFVSVNSYTVDQLLVNHPEIKKMKKKSTKAVFLAGAGVRYEFNPSMFAKLEYNFEFGAKPKLHAEAMPELQKVKVTSHTIKLGLGYRF